MGGSSKKQVTGYKYYLGLHFGVCHGPVDGIGQIEVGERIAWEGLADENTRIRVRKNDLFGGKEREGGVDTFVDVMMGGPAQAKNDYLVSQLGEVQPAYRGITSLVVRGPSSERIRDTRLFQSTSYLYGGYVAANNPYLKPWAFRVKRIKEGWDQGVWYPSTAEVPIFINEGGSDSEADSDDDEMVLLDSIFLSGTGNAGTNPGVGVTVQNPSGCPVYVRITSGAWSYFEDDAANGGYTWICNFTATRPGHPERELEFYPQVYQTSDAAFAATGGTLIQLPASTQYTFWLYDTPVFDNRGGMLMDVYTYCPPAPPGEKMALGGMNPAHIIYQSLTDPEWGMGYPVDSIDEENFTIAADKLYGEGLGLCMIWNRQESIDGFIQIVLDHAGAVLYSDRRTGKFKLKLLRDDYDPDTLPVFGENEICGVDSFQRPGFGETINEITVVYRDIATNKDTSVTVQDLANIQAQGGIVSQTRNYPGLPIQGLAARIAMRDLRAAATPLAKVEARFNRSFWDTVPGDVVKLVWPQYGINGAVFRVVTADYGDLTNGEIKAVLVEDVFGLDPGAYIKQQENEWSEPNNQAAPNPQEDLFEVPYWHDARVLVADVDALAPEVGFVGTVATPASSLTYQYRINTSFSGDSDEDFVDRGVASYTPSAILGGPVTQATTTFEVMNRSDFDADAFVGPTLAMIGSGRPAEWVEVLSAETDSNGSHYVTVARGVLDTTPQDWAANTRIWFAGETDAGADLTQYLAGDAIDVKLTSQATGAELELAQAETLSIVMDQRMYRPYPPGNILINGEAYPEALSGSLSITWAHRDRTQQLADVIHQDAGDIGPEPGVTYNVRFYDDATNTLIASATGLTGTSYSNLLAAVEYLRVEIDSTRDGIQSWQPQIRRFVYGGFGVRAAEDGELRATEDNDQRDIESVPPDANGDGDFGASVIPYLWNGTEFVCLSYQHDPVTGGNVQVVVTTTNGLDLVSRGKLTNYRMEAVAGSPYRYVAVRGFNTGFGYRSEVATTNSLDNDWTQQTLTVFAARGYYNYPVTFSCVVYDPSFDKFVIAGDYGLVLTSSDGTSWTETGTGSISPFFATYSLATDGAGTFVLTGWITPDGYVPIFGYPGTPIVYRSTDLVNWTEVTVPGFTAPRTLGPVAFINGHFAVTSGDALADYDSSSEATIATSPDGVTWDTHFGPGVGGEITYFDAKYVMISLLIGEQLLCTSPDLDSWTTHDVAVKPHGSMTPGDGFMLGVGFADNSYAPDGYTIVSGYPYLIRTEDGINWD